MNNTNTSKIKKVYHLRKTVTSALKKDRAQQEKPQKEESSQFKVDIDDSNNHLNIQPNQNNNSFLKKNNNAQENQTFEQETTHISLDGPELSVNTLFLSFQQKLDFIQTRQLKLKNIGSSAIYYQWKFKNQPKINSSSIKDIKPKFFCHYSKQSIKPGEQITFIFSFVSQIPGFFTEQCELICEPALITPIPVIRLQGKAYIDDEWRQERAKFLQELEASMRQCSVQQTVDDLIDEVRLPPPQRPNVKDLKIAEEIFEKTNENLKLYFNPYIHKWFNELYEEVWNKQNPGHKVAQEAYWDQSIETFRNFISNCQNIDDVEKKCFLERLQHYTHLSTFSLPNKSEIYQTVYKMISDAAYRLGGDLADSVKKELDMWEVPFREPLDIDTDEDLKARKQEVEKIKAEWLKRTKKKKWGQEQDKAMLEDFKNKLKAKATQEILAKFEGFENQAQYTKIQKVVQNDKFNPQKYFLFLQRMKTVNEYSFEGKKVLLKFNLKLKDNCEKQIQELNEYLIKKQEEKKKIQQEKKNTDAKKKKPAPKKKGQKEQQEQKPLTFDFSSILEEQNWNGFLETFRNIQQRSPFMILIGCTYRQRLGRADQNMTVGFLLEHLKSIEPSIEFMSHGQLFKLKQNIENEVISEGSIFLVENLNFLSSQTLSCEEIQTYQENGIQKQKKTKRNVLYPEVRSQLDLWTPLLDVIVDEDRFLTKWSGISSYSHVQVVLGKKWWNYVAYAQRSQNQSFILSGDFNPQSYFLLCRILQYAKLVYLTANLAIKFRMAQKSIKKLGNINLNDKQVTLINQILCNNSSKLIIPDKFKFLEAQKEEEQRKCAEFNFSQEEQTNPEQFSGYQFVDVSGDISQLIAQNSSSGHLYMIGKSHTVDYSQKMFGLNSTTQILKAIYKLQQQKRTRHSIEVNTPSGIDYNNDLVFYLIGINQKDVQTIQFKQKKVRIVQNQQGNQDEEPDQVEEPEDQGELQKKKIDLVADFNLSSHETMVNLLSGKFDHGLKNISKYPKPRII